MKQEFKCSLEERTSKSGNPYTVLVVKITDKIEKLVFLTPAEIELLKMNSKPSSIIH